MNPTAGAAPDGKLPEAGCRGGEIHLFVQTSIVSRENDDPLRFAKVNYRTNSLFTADGWNRAGHQAGPGSETGWRLT